MTARILRAGRVASLVALALVLVGCSSGGFSGTQVQTKQRSLLKTYVALGDGFAAAPLVGQSVSDHGCLRSTTNYPARVASRLGVRLTDVTCTGASTAAVLRSSKAPVGNGRLAAQLDAVRPDTDLVTLTIGISDDQLLYRGLYVCMAVPCGTRIAPQDLSAEAEAAGTATADIVNAIMKKAPNATVVLVGYPQITPSQTSCGALPALTTAELAGANALYYVINQQMQVAARQTGATFVDLSTVTQNHDVCALVPWIRRPAAKTDPRAALHPLGPEQKAAADAVIAAVNQR